MRLKNIQNIIKTREFITFILSLMEIKTKTVNACQLMFLILKRFIKMTLRSNGKLKGQGKIF